MSLFYRTAFDHLSINDKVFHYLHNATSKSPRPYSSSKGFLTPQSCGNRAGSDDDSSKSDCSPVSSCSTEEFDFNLTFDQIDDDVEDMRISDPMNDVDTILNESKFNERLNDYEEYLGQASDSENKTSSTFTLCSSDNFSAYDEDHHSSPTHFAIRSNSLAILQWDDKATLVDKAPKKVVRFADMMGLDLESIRYMTPPDLTQSNSSLNDESIRMKLEQFRSTKYSLISPRRVSSVKLPSKQYYLVSRNFTSPINIVPIIYEKKILLECLYTKDSTAYGTIRVHNIAYDKRVFVRLTVDEWTTYTDIQAWHSMNYAHDNTDAFTFQINLRQMHDQSEVPKRILFAVCVQTTSEEFWDNNQNWNYVLDVFERN